MCGYGDSPSKDSSLVLGLVFDKEANMILRVTGRGHGSDIELTNLECIIVLDQVSNSGSGVRACDDFNTGVALDKFLPGMLASVSPEPVLCTILPAYLVTSTVIGVMVGGNQVISELDASCISRRLKLVRIIGIHNGSLFGRLVVQNVHIVVRTSSNWDDAHGGPE